MEVKLIAYTKGENGESPEKIIELATRTSYKSFQNIEIGSEKKLIRHILNLGHLSVLEHASATFRILGISRACSHQLVRHRLASFTQESQRYVNQEKAMFIMPKSIDKNIKARTEFIAISNKIRKAYKELINLGIPKEDARYILPNAITTEIVMTANFREWLHITNLRTQKNAQWEIKELMIRINNELNKIAPTIFKKIEGPI